MKKNDEIEVVIDDIGASGEGIAHYEDITIFVPFTITGEKCLVHILKVKDNLAWAKVLNVLSKNKNRTVPKCEYYEKCGGCTLEHVNSEFELNVKKQKILTAFKKNASLDIPNIEMINSNKIYGYRNKCAFPVRNINGVSVVCMFKGNSHNPIPIKRCELADENINKIINIFNEFLQKNKISAYNEEDNTGIVKFLVVRVLNSVPLITIVINDKKFDKAQCLVEMLGKCFNKFGLNLNINLVNNNVILTDKFIHIYGEKELVSSEFGITYPVSSLSFLQINDFIKSKIYNNVLSLIDNDDIVIDAYSGAGLMSAMIAKRAKFVYGIEIIKDATADANFLSQKNNIKNLVNINADCSVELPKLVKKLGDNQIKVVLDPPRKGCDKKVINSIIESCVDKIIYISCNPATLARDAKFLCDANYKIVSVSGYNMFPQTEHVETLAIFQRREIDEN